MLTNRIVGAFTFRREVYAEVEQDLSFTSTAWMLVVVVNLLNQLGSLAGGSVRGIGDWVIGAVLGTVFAVIGFAAAAFVISIVGRSVFKAQVTFDELVRTLGLASVWNVIGFLAILGAISGVLVCIVSPALILGAILGLIAWFVAVKEALDLEWVQTIVTVVIGFIVLLIVNAVAALILSLFGIVGAGILGAL
jgi:hypothetical protein